MARFPGASEKQVIVKKLIRQKVPFLTRISLQRDQGDRNDSLRNVDDVNSARFSRRNVLAVGATVALSGFASIFSEPVKAISAIEASEGKRPGVAGIKALVFDVYGTSTDYWGTIVREGQVINRRKGLNIDWAAIADDWHGLFPPSFQAVLNGQRPWQSFASLRLEALENALQKEGISEFSRDELIDINSVWQRLEPWPDVVPGLQRLHDRHVLATLSNADMADMVKLARHSNLRWDLILTAELARSVKPDPRVYQLAPGYLGLEPEEIMMVACHKTDLQGAKRQGFRTAFISRPLEGGPNGGADTKADAQFDLNARSFIELANLLTV
jgi:2-haloacid dehalogenase